MSNPVIVVFAFIRTHSLNVTLLSLSKVTTHKISNLFFKVKGIEKYKVYISQDGFDPQVSNVVRKEYPQFQLLQRERVTLLSPTQESSAYVAQHYKYLCN